MCSTDTHDTESQLDLMEDDDSTSAKRDVQFTKNIHSRIEKRRRDKMNAYIRELAAMIPMCKAMANQKLDKLTVLRMVVQHMKTLRGSTSLTFTEDANKPNFLSEAKIKHLLLKSAEGFLLVVSCDRGRLLYVSRSVEDILHAKQSELMGQSFFDIVHPNDMVKVKEQLLSFDVSPRERFIDAKTMMPVKTELPQKSSRLCSGSRRSFYCRLRAQGPPGGGAGDVAGGGGAVPGDHPTKQEHFDPTCHPNPEPKMYVTIQCVGYIKSWPHAALGVGEDGEGGEAGDLSCLVGVALSAQGEVDSPASSTGTVPPTHDRAFTSRHSCDGKFTYVDKRVYSALGYMPQELVGTSLYEYCHPEDVKSLKRLHKRVLQTNLKLEALPLRFKTSSGPYILLKVVMEAFVNPWTSTTDFIVVRNQVVPPPEVTSSQPAFQPGTSSDGAPQCHGFGSGSRAVACAGPADLCEMGVSSWLSDTRPARGVGTDVLDEIQSVGSGSVECTSSSQDKHQPVAVVHGSSNLTKEGLLNRKMMPPPSRCPAEHHPHLLVASLPAPTLSDYNLSESATSTSESDEATMAMIMSVLEADGGLGQDISDLDWP